MTAARLSPLIKMEVHGFRLRFYRTAISEGYWWNGGGYRREDHDFLARYLRADDTVVDVGANVGALCLHAAALVGRAGRVVAFEAHPRTHRYLRGNLSLNRTRNVRTHQVALGSGTGEVTFTDRRADDQNAVDAAGPVRVRLAPLDAFTGALGTVDLLKVDVEGYELEVLRGATETLRRTSCVRFEVCDRHFAKYDYGTPDLLALLSGLGFSTFLLRDGELRPVPPDFRSERCEDLVATRDPATLRERLRRAQPSPAPRSRWTAPAGSSART